MACLKGLVELGCRGGLAGGIDCVGAIVCVLLGKGRGCVVTGGIDCIGAIGCVLLVAGRGCVFAGLAGKAADSTLESGTDAVYKFWVLFTGVEENGREFCWLLLVGWVTTSFFFNSASTRSSITLSFSSVSDPRCDFVLSKSSSPSSSSFSDSLKILR
jgi:hypothetical protein